MPAASRRALEIVEKARERSAAAQVSTVARRLAGADD